METCSCAGNIGEILEKLRFLNGPSLVTSHMRFSHYQQCVQYVEPENVTRPVHSWVTPRLSPASFLYQVPEGVPPPLGMRSAVPLGGLGTGDVHMSIFLVIVGNKSTWAGVNSVFRSVQRKLKWAVRGFIRRGGQRDASWPCIGWCCVCCM